MATPFDLYVTFDNGKREVYHQTPEIWQANQKEAKFIINSNENIKSILIDGRIFMDADESNNNWLARK